VVVLVFFMGTDLRLTVTFGPQSTDTDGTPFVKHLDCVIVELMRVAARTRKRVRRAQQYEMYATYIYVNVSNFDGRLALTVLVAPQTNTISSTFRLLGIHSGTHCWLF